MSDQNRLTIFSKEHQIAFPVASLPPFVDVGRTPPNGHTAFNVPHGAPAFTSPPATLAFSPRQIMSPAIVFGASDLRVNESIDGFITDDVTSFSLIQSSGHLSGRPALSQPFQYFLLKFDIAQQSTSSPVAARGLLLSIRRLITQFRTAVALKLSRYSRWRAIHNCRDLADCFPSLAKTGNRTTFFKRKVSIAFSHCNTLYKRCCTWFVNLGHTEVFEIPGFRLALAIASLAGMTFELFTNLRNTKLGLVITDYQNSSGFK